MSYYKDNDGNAEKGINDYMNSLSCPICNFQFQSTRRTAAQEGVIIRHITECSEKKQKERSTTTNKQESSVKQIKDKKTVTKKIKKKAQKARLTKSGVGSASLKANRSKNKINVGKSQRERAGIKIAEDGDDGNRPLDSITTTTPLLSSSPSLWSLSQAPNICHALICKEAVKNLQEEKQSFVLGTEMQKKNKAKRSLEKVKQKSDSPQVVLDKDKIGLINDSSSSQDDYSNKTIVSFPPAISGQGRVHNDDAVTRKEDNNMRGNAPHQESKEEPVKKDEQEKTATSSWTGKNNAKKRKTTLEVEEVKLLMTKKTRKNHRHSAGDMISKTLVPEIKSRRNKQNTISCPICQKVFKRGTVSMSKINKHVLMCSDAQEKELGTEAVDGPSISLNKHHDTSGMTTKDSNNLKGDPQKQQSYHNHIIRYATPQNSSEDLSLSSNDLIKSPKSEDNLVFSLDEYYTRGAQKTGQNSASCPICGKIWNRSTVSIAEINKHVVMCADAQKYDTESSSKSSSDSMTSYSRSMKKECHTELSKSQRYVRKSLHHSLSQSNKDTKKQRSQSLQCLKKGSAKKALELTLLKYLDSKSSTML